MTTVLDPYYSDPTVALPQHFNTAGLSSQHHPTTSDTDGMIQRSPLQLLQSHSSGQKENMQMNGGGGNNNFLSFFSSVYDGDLAEIAHDVFASHLPNASPLRSKSLMQTGFEYLPSPHKPSQHTQHLIHQQQGHRHHVLSSPFTGMTQSPLPALISSPAPAGATGHTHSMLLTPQPLFSGMVKHSNPNRTGEHANKRLFDSNDGVVATDSDGDNLQSPSKRPRIGVALQTYIDDITQSTHPSIYTNSPSRHHTAGQSLIGSTSYTPLSPNPNSLSTMGTDASSFSPFRRFSPNNHMLRNGHTIDTDAALQRVQYLSSPMNASSKRNTGFALLNSNVNRNLNLSTAQPTTPRYTLVSADDGADTIRVKRESATKSSRNPHVATRASHTSTDIGTLPALQDTDSIINEQLEELGASVLRDPTLSGQSSLQHEVTGSLHPHSDDDGNSDDDEEDDMHDDGTSMLLTASASKSKAPTSRRTSLSASKKLTTSASKKSASGPTKAQILAAEKRQQNRQRRLGKGLRHFSIKVCQKVEEQQITTYNSVADDLVRELQATAQAEGTLTLERNPATGHSKVIAGDKQYDEKNIRRRVYDALNVLMAMGIIMKEKKTITWVGLPHNVQANVQKLKQARATRMQAIKDKKQDLSDYCVELITQMALIKRNRAQPKQERDTDSSQVIDTPFLLVTAPSGTNLDVDTSDTTAVKFSLDRAPQTVQHSQLMTSMGLANITPYELRRHIPVEILPFYPQQYVIKEEDVSVKEEDSKAKA